MRKKNATNLRSQLSGSCTDRGQQLSGSCTDRGQQLIFALRNSKYNFSDTPITEDSSSEGTLIINLANFMAQLWQSGMECNQGAYLAGNLGRV